MNNSTTSLTQCLLNNLGPDLETALKETVRGMLEEAFNEMMKIELTSFLQYEPYERCDGDDYRNGYSEKTFSTSFGTINLKIPRDRLNRYSTALVNRYQRHDGSTEDTILKLFQSGLTNSEISEIVEALYSRKYSSTTVSNITRKVTDNVQAFRERKLRSHYAVVYVDATYVSVRRDTVDKEGLSIAIGITPEGYKEVLGYILTPQESASIWDELLQDFKARGVETVSLFVTDGLSGMPEAIERNFPSSRIQRCLVHVQRNIIAKARVKDRKEISSDFKKVYTASCKEEGQDYLEQFKAKWGTKYRNIIKSLNSSESYLLTFYDFPKSCWQSIYTTNIIEGFNKQIKRMTKHKEQFPDPDSLERFIVSLFNDYNEKFMCRIHKGFKEAGDSWRQLYDK